MVWRKEDPNGLLKNSPLEASNGGGSGIRDGSGSSHPLDPPDILKTQGDSSGSPNLQKQQSESGKMEKRLEILLQCPRLEMSQWKTLLRSVGRRELPNLHSFVNKWSRKDLLLELSRGKE